MLLGKALRVSAGLTLAACAFNLSAGQAAPPGPQIAQASTDYDVSDIPIYTRDWVSELQSRLKGAGFEVDTETGAFTDRTRKAIAEFQSKNQLAVSGQPTPSLMRVLRSAKVNPENSD